jgi:DNA-binding transcriptional ArsR family regulator
MFRAVADPNRLRVLIRLAEGELNVGQLCEVEGEKIATMSARLKVLSAARLVSRRRAGQTIIYAIADTHVLNLVDNAIAHACETHSPSSVNRTEGENAMTTHHHLTHAEHPHHHGPKCGHLAVKHGGHVDYLHDGHLHRQEGDEVDEHVIEVTARNPVGCTPANGHKGHEAGHVHGPGCGHEAVPHGDHVDYLVGDRLHHPHGDHCDDHGPLEVVGAKA